MEGQLLKKVVVNSLRGYESIALDAGIPFVEFTDEQLEAMSLTDVERLAKQLQALLRTPRS